MSACKVKYCKNSWQKNQCVPTATTTKFFRFPKDPFFREKWTLACGLTVIKAKDRKHYVILFFCNNCEKSRLIRQK